MMIIQLVLTAIILGIVYKKMLKWECDMSINKKQAFVPIFLGVLATMLTLVFALGIAFTFMNMGFTIENIQNVVIKSFVTSFWRAGLIEEISRLLMIILAIWLFKPKNVYEYILTGAAVGIGITLLEEFVYGEDIEGLLRLITLGVHTIFGIIMGKYIGIGQYNKKNGLPYKLQYLIAFSVPVILHTIYDVCTVFNPAIFINNIDDERTGIWILIGLVCIVFTTLFQFVAIKRVKRDAEKYSKMLM